MSNNDNKIIPTLDDVIKPGDLDKAVINDLSSLDNSDDTDEEVAIELFTDASAELDDTFDTEFDKLYAGASSPTQSAEPDADLLEAEADEISLQPETEQAAPETTETPVTRLADTDDENTKEPALDSPGSSDADLLETDISALEETPEHFQVASKENNAVTEITVADDDFPEGHDDLADLIVAESFPQNDAALHASIEDDTDDLVLDDNDRPREHDVAAWGEPVVKFDDAAETQAQATSTADAVPDSSAAAPAADTTDAPAEKTQSAAPGATDINIGALVDDITRQLMPEIEWKIRTRLREALDEIFPEN